MAHAAGGQPLEVLELPHPGQCRTGEWPVGPLNPAPVTNVRGSEIWGSTNPMFRSTNLPEPATAEASAAATAKSTPTGVR